jgi:hypothetical protein
MPIPDAQPRRLSRMQDIQANFREARLDERSINGVNRNERGNNPSAPTATVGTQTGFETDEYRDRDANAPPPSSMNTNNASQQSGQASQNRDQRQSGEPRESIEHEQRSPTPFEAPRTASPEPKPKIDLIFSYDALPGFNLRLFHGEEMFSFSHEQLFQETGWQHDFDWLLISLKAPAVLFLERIPKADNREFRKVMARFEQIVDTMKRDYAELERDAVIEVSFVPECKGHSGTVMVDAWKKRLDKSRGVVF